MKSICPAADMQLCRRLFRFAPPDALPVSFRLGSRTVRGLPEDFRPVCATRRIDANLQQTLVRGRSGDGLEVCIEYTEYLDAPVVELIAFFTNAGASDTPVLSDIRILDAVLPCGNAALVHGNGDTCREDGYRWFREAIDREHSLAPADGTSCNGAFPYMRLVCDDLCISLAVGWPGMWRADFAPEDGGVRIRAGQKRCHTVLHPGETLRTPRITLLASSGDEVRAANLWRRWYLAHILPRENGRPLPPKCCMHVFNAGGKPEFTGATEENQLSGMAEYLRRGVRPDVWWIDAGWYPCHYEWPVIGTWTPDAARFPRGLGPIGRACAENGMQLLLWFEPERVRPGTELDLEHPEWLIRLRGEDGSVFENRLLNLGDAACCEWITDRIDAILKASGASIYRQDFNFDPAPYWEQAESADRIGAIENFHIQGYLKLWDGLLLRNPGLWIDSCASGGRRNDLETMRRAVPLHYTDVGYGHHPIKQRQHRQMFEWIPYFRAHNMNWDDPDTGDYGSRNRPADRYSYYAAMAPALTDMLEHDADESGYALAREMQPIWRRAAGLMLRGDYYPLTDREPTQSSFCALQFHDPDTETGFIEIMRNNRCAESALTLRLRALDPSAVYVLTEAETGARQEIPGDRLAGGLTVELPLRSGRIYFYTRRR